MPTHLPYLHPIFLPQRDCTCHICSQSQFLRYLQKIRFTTIVIVRTTWNSLHTPFSNFTFISDTFCFPFSHSTFFGEIVQATSHISEISEKIFREWIVRQWHGLLPVSSITGSRVAALAGSEHSRGLHGRFDLKLNFWDNKTIFFFGEKAHYLALLGPF